MVCHCLTLKLLERHVLQKEAITGKWYSGKLLSLLPGHLSVYNKRLRLLEASFLRLVWHSPCVILPTVSLATLMDEVGQQLVYFGVVGN